MFKLILVAIFFLNLPASASDIDQKLEFAIGKIIEEFDSNTKSRIIDDYTNLTKIKYLKDRRVMILTHEVDVFGMLHRDYLYESDAVGIKNKNKLKVCSSDFAILVKNNLISVEHVFVDKKTKHLVLKYLISSKECGNLNEK